VVVREAALDGEERLEIVLILFRVRRRPRADRAWRGGVAAPRGVARRQRGGRRGLVDSVEVLADDANKGQVLALLLIVVRGEAIATHRRRGRRRGEGGGGGPSEAGTGELRDYGVWVGHR